MYPCMFSLSLYFSTSTYPYGTDQKGSESLLLYYFQGDDSALIESRVTEISLYSDLLKRDFRLKCDSFEEAMDWR